MLAVIGLLAAIILPSVPRATSRAKLESFAVQTAALLKADRNAALRRQVQIVDAGRCAVAFDPLRRQPASVVRLPDDVTGRCDPGLALRGPQRRPLDRFLSLGHVVRRHDRNGAAGNGI